MNRRADRVIAVTAVAAVAVVPTVLLLVIKTGVASPLGAGVLPAAEQANAAPNATKTPEPKTATPNPAKPAGNSPPRFPPTPTPIPPTYTPPPSKPPSGVTSYVRVTDAKLANTDSPDTQQITETTKIVLKPKFAMNAVGVRKVTVAGVTTQTTQKVIVKGDTMSTYDGKKWAHSKLTADELARLKAGSDPRKFTGLIRLAPGLKTSKDKFGSTHYQAQATLGDLLKLLPKSVADEVQKTFPGFLGIYLDLWADKLDRPSWVGLGVVAPGPLINASMIFKDYK